MEKRMNLPRRRFLQMATGAAALPTMLGRAFAETYPARPVRIIVPSAAGDPTDTVGRIMAQWLSEHLGQPFVTEDRPGAGSNLGTETVVRSPADGYTLLIVAASAAINATLYENLKFNFLRDIAPIADMVRQPQFFVINRTIPVATIPEFVAYAKANPGKLSFASPGIGTAPHLAGELFKMMSGIEMTHVPYHGAAAALNDMMSGQVQVMITAAAGELVKAGKLRALAVTSARRLGQAPEVPTVAEFLPGYESIIWFGIGAPKQVPVDIVNLLNREINSGLDDQKIRERFSELGADIVRGTPADFGKFIADETEKWAKVVKFCGAKVSEFP
jgi:tripartite-type tricarboxylate transporter receptor subunit TctC